MMMMFVKKKSKEVIAKTAVKKTRMYYQYDLDRIFLQEWFGTKAIKDALGIIKTSISNCCQGRTKTAGGFIWSYVKL